MDNLYRAILTLWFLLTASTVPAIAAEDLALDESRVLIVVDPVRQILGGPNYLSEKQYSNPYSGESSASYFDVYGIGATIAGASSLLSFAEGDRGLSQALSAASRSFDFEVSISDLAFSLAEEAEWTLIGVESAYDISQRDIRDYAQRVLGRSDANYVIFLRLEYFMSKNLGQVRLRALCTVYQKGRKRELPARIGLWNYEYLSASRGNLLRTWHPGEREALLELVELEFEKNLERFPHNRKAYEKDRRDALKILNYGDRILDGMAIEEGWPRDSLARELLAATDAMGEVLQLDTRSLSGREKLESERVKFLGLNDSGAEKTRKGQFVTTVGNHQVFRISNGETMIVPSANNQ